MAEITFASANRHASASACFGHNATALLPHCANTSARRLTAPALTNIGEPALNLMSLRRNLCCAKYFANISAITIDKAVRILYICSAESRSIA